MGQEPPTIEQIAKSAADKAKILAFVTEQYSLIKTARTKVVRQWYLNLAFYAGRQNVQVVNTAASSLGFRLNVPKAPPWRVRMVVNKIRPIIRSELSKVTAQKPTFTVVPASTDDEDQTASRVGQQIFEAAYTDYNIGRVIKKAEWWTVLCGTGFIKDYWDKYKKDPNGAKGSVCIDPITPFHIFIPDLSEQDIEDQPFIIHASTKPQDWVQNYYGKELGKTSVNATNEIFEETFLDLSSMRQVKKNQVLILEVWFKPGAFKVFPEGGMCTIVGDEVVQAQSGEIYKHGDSPFTKLEHIPTGKFYSESVITDLIPLQREYNRTKSQIIEAKNLMSKPKLLAPRGSLNPNQITSEPGQVILYEPGFTPPQPLPLQSIPAYVMQELDRIQSDMDDISSQHEISRGNTPSQVTAATAISYLQEQDDSKLAHTIQSLEEGISKIGRHYLSHVSQFWDKERLVRIVGEDGSFDAQQYTKDKLRGNIDLRVEAGSALPTSKAAKQAFVMDLAKMGVIPPEQVVSVLDLKGIEKINADFQADLRQAQRENVKMSQGMIQGQPQVDPATGQPQVDPNTNQPVMGPPVLYPNSWDNHKAHIDVHNRFRKSQEFEDLADNFKVMFESHVQIHEQQIQVAAMQQMQQQMGQQNPGGQPPQKGSMSQQPPQGGPPNG